MTEPASLPSTTARFALPLLFPGQSQREFAINEALARCDALLHASITGEASTPPSNPAEGDVWLVIPNATGAFSGREGCIAVRALGQWTYISPCDGMRIFDRASGQTLFYSSGWLRTDPISLPLGGSTIDAEARAAIATIADILQQSGIVPSI